MRVNVSRWNLEHDSELIFDIKCYYNGLIHAPTNIPAIISRDGKHKIYVEQGVIIKNSYMLNLYITLEKITKGIHTFYIDQTTNREKDFNTAVFSKEMMQVNNINKTKSILAIRVSTTRTLINI